MFFCAFAGIGAKVLKCCLNRGYKAKAMLAVAKHLGGATPPKASDCWLGKSLAIMPADQFFV